LALNAGNLPIMVRAAEEPSKPAQLTSVLLPTSPKRAP
jgi:hypothetical protein